jgi:hypothetical protein
MIAVLSSRKAHSEDQEHLPHVGAGDLHRYFVEVGYVVQGRSKKSSSKFADKLALLRRNRARSLEPTDYRS